MKASELREMTTEQLHEELLSLRKEQFNLRVQKAVGQVAKPHYFSQARKKIARIKTILHEKVSSDNDK